MSIDRIGENNGDQGPMSPWGRSAAASNNYGEQQPSGVEVNGDMQDGDETQGEQGVATPMTLEEFRRTYATIDNVYNEYSDKTHETKRGDQRQRAEVLANQERQIKEARKEFDRRCREIREAASVQMQQIQESTKVAQTLAVIKEESSKRMNEAIAPLAAADKASDETLRQFIHDFDERRERGELTLDDVELWYFVVAIAERNSWQRKNVLRTSADLESEEAAPWEVKVGEASPVAYATNDREALSGSRQRTALQFPRVVLELGKGAIEGYIRRMLEPYVRGGIISPRYSVHVDEESYYDKVYIREVRVESNCGGFSFLEDATDHLDS